MLKLAIRIIMLMGAGIYLFLFGVTMAFGSFTWHADFIGTHGEPFLVIVLAAWMFIEATDKLINTANGKPSILENFDKSSRYALERLHSRSDETRGSEKELVSTKEVD